MDAQDFLELAGSAIGDRAKDRDTPKERSMKRTVDAFNALYGTNLTETQGWGFMVLLKLVRGSQGNFRMDDYTDAVAYTALLSECELQAFNRRAEAQRADNQPD
jgi:hypothetical protein